jgi:predicted MFS family arabinose efflux permease
VLDLHLLNRVIFPLRCFAFPGRHCHEWSHAASTIMLQQVRGESVLFVGFLLVSQGFGKLLTRSWVGSLADRIGSRTIVIISLVVTAVGTLPFAFAGSDTNQILLAAALLIRIAGLGGLLIPIMASVYMGLSRDQVSHARLQRGFYK